MQISRRVQKSESQYFFPLLLECVQNSDCPNGGQNYYCIANTCFCEDGFILNGDACVGMLINNKLLFFFKNLKGDFKINSV